MSVSIELQAKGERVLKYTCGNESAYIKHLGGRAPYQWYLTSEERKHYFFVSCIRFFSLINSLLLKDGSAAHYPQCIQSNEISLMADDDLYRAVHKSGYIWFPYFLILVFLALRTTLMWFVPSPTRIGRKHGGDEKIFSCLI